MHCHSAMGVGHGAVRLDSRFERDSTSVVFTHFPWRCGESILLSLITLAGLPSTAQTAVGSASPGVEDARELLSQTMSRESEGRIRLVEFRNCQTPPVGARQLKVDGTSRADDRVPRPPAVRGQAQADLASHVAVGVLARRKISISDQHKCRRDDGALHARDKWV